MVKSLPFQKGKGKLDRIFQIYFRIFHEDVNSFFPFFVVFSDVLLHRLAQ